MRRQLTLLAVAGLSLVTLAGCSPAASPSASPSPSGSCAGVTVIVTYGLLGENSGPANITACAPLASGTETVADALAAVKVTTEGTAKYGDQVVCRVNGFPAADKPFTVPGHNPYSEKCSTMAPEFAYWALWIRPGQGKWDYATEGASTQKVAVGDSIGLVFTTGRATPTPTS